MDSFEFNKIAGAVLGTCLFTLGLGVLSEIIFHSPAPAKPGFEVATAEASGGSAGGGQAESAAVAATPIAERLKTATADDGKKVFGKCSSCHNPDKGGKNGTGPNLWGVVGGPLGHAEGFAYSAGIKEGAAAGQKWDFAHLDEFLANPAGVVKGTKMSFKGLPKPEERAAVIAYLRSLSDNPVPLP
ncbi:c-type cytochrome [Prosthecomicrobium hirschii]|mgnify:CR=1 FL=1|uniref:c-type cytochrome n=1 Tax=Prosthecodimorpha hirschii TaxID=665126 RepID=UPI0009FA2BAA|nr:cytochrome c family protein [Prosthecomicrobium hirschii]MCW1841683.1 cytochrome c family protein [Prosthecomicrobium hirschii]TPQ51534.1 cytochrome c family protein [Prosthecomicrobium hirschii]